jgi:hypothetical protein
VRVICDGSGVPLCMHPWMGCGGGQGEGREWPVGVSDPGQERVPGALGWAALDKSRNSSGVVVGGCLDPGLHTRFPAR